MHATETLFQTLATAAPQASPPQGPGWAMLIPALPLIGCVLAGLCAAFKVKSKFPAWLSVGCLATSFALTLNLYLQHFSGGNGPVLITTAFEWINLQWGPAEGQQLVANFGFYLDSLTVLWMLFVTGLATLIALYASEYMSHDVGAGYCRFFAAFNLFVFSMACLVMADNLLLLYLGWEGVGLCSYLLIGYFYKKPSAVAAAKKAFIVNRIGDLFLALGIFLTFVHFGSVEYAVIFEKAAPYIASLQAGNLDQIPAVVQLIPLLLMVGAFGKSAQLPLYVWLPDAMEGPTPVSALIHAATMVTAGVFLIARTYPLFLLSDHALPIVGWVGALTALFAATIGMAQFDIKRIMAYSTVSQLGYMFAGLAVLTPSGGAAHVFTHAFFKAMLFLSCGAVMHGFAGQLDLRKLSGVGKLPGWKVVNIAMLVGCLNLAGFPLITAGYWSKDLILGEAFANPHTAAIGWILLLTAGLTAYYTFRVYFRVFMGPVSFEPGDENHDAAHAAHGHDAAHAAAHSHTTHDASPPLAEAQVEAEHPHAHTPHPAHQDFHPHAPGWAINTVLATLAIASFAAIFAVHSFGSSPSWLESMVGGSSAHYTGVAAYQAAHESHATPAATPSTADATPGNDPVPTTPESGLTTPDTHADAHAHGNHQLFFGFDAHKALMVVSGVVGAIGIFFAWLLHLRGRTTAAYSDADKLIPALGPIPKLAQHKWYIDEIYDALIRRPLRGLAHAFHLIDQFLVDGLVNIFGALPRWVGATVRPSQSGEMHGYALGMAGGIAVLLVIVLLASN